MIEKYIKEISDTLSLDTNTVQGLLEVPPDNKLGDLAIPCFSLAKNKDIQKFAQGHIKKFENSSLFSKIEFVNGYLNFFYDRNNFAKNILQKVLGDKNLCISKIKEGKNVVIEFSSPNIAKTFGVGHMRSTIIGNSLSKIYKKVGANVIKVNYLGDWGTQFGKLLYGYNNFFIPKNGKKFDIEDMQDIYVKVNLNMTDEVERKSREYFKKLESLDKDSVQMWKKFKEISLKQFNKIYKVLGIEFDLVSGESEYNELSKKVVKKLEQNTLVTVSEEAKIINLEKFGLHTAVLEKHDGTSIYLSRDVACAIDRIEKFNFDEMIYEVGTEQKLHFKQLTKILDLLGYKRGESIMHVGHGLYLGKDNKKLSSRQGTSLSVEEIWNSIRSELIKHYKSNKKDIPNDKDLNIIIRASVIYFDLKGERQSNVVFNIEKLIDQNGNSGVYLLYSFARANMILKKSKMKNVPSDFNQELSEEEFDLLKSISKYPSVIKNAVEQKEPSKIANYVYSLSQKFNLFYNSCRVVGSKKENFRIRIVESYKVILEDSLNLLGIETLEKI